MKNFIYNAAYETGFFAVGITSAEHLTELEHLERWLAKNHNASMAWMKRDPAARCNPISILPNTKSVICCALAYGENGIEKIPPSPPFPTGGKQKYPPLQMGVKGDLNKAMFARGLEYHEVVREKLKKLRDTIHKEAPHANCRLCVDTSPILEKALAVRSGIGWRGKHSVVVHPKRGSYFVLGEIITDVKIEPDGPIKNRCGNCKKCIAACPTQAITKPYIIDARRCISYLTIEHKGPIPNELKNHIKAGQYGCDICQDACPYNKSSEKVSDFILRACREDKILFASRLANARSKNKK